MARAYCAGPKHSSATQRQAIVQARGAALPELDAQWLQQIAAPVRGPRDLPFAGAPR
jgi:hypothetical protein